MATETVYRSFLKAMSYRLLSTTITSGIVFGVTGNGGLAVGVAIFDSSIKILSYYLHERAWAFIRFGLAENSLEEFEVYKTLTDSEKRDLRPALSEIGLTEKA